MEQEATDLFINNQYTPAFTCLFRQENICFRNRSVGNLAYFGFLKIGLDVIEVCTFYSFRRKKKFTLEDMNVIPVCDHGPEVEK